MSKMLKSDLKIVIKECLLEILAEGLGSSINETIVKKKNVIAMNEKKQELTRMQERKRELHDTISFMSNDPVMQEVLSHTAANNHIPDENSRDPRAAMNSIAGDSGIDIDKIFNKDWAKMAFSGQKKLG